MSRAPTRGRYPWTIHQSALALVLALYAALALAYNLADPLFEPPDEILHYDFVRYLQRERALPVVGLTDPPSEYHQPPLYYALAAVLTAWIPAEDYPAHVQRNPFWAYDIGAVGSDNKHQFLHGPAESFPYRQTSLAVHLIRLLSTFAGAATVYCTYRFALSLLPGNYPLALATASLVAFTPNFLLTTAAVTNDAFASMAPVGLMLYIFHLLEQPAVARLSHWAVLSALLTLAVLTKTSSLPLLMIAAALAGMLARRHRSWRVFVTAGLILGGGAVLFAGWWFARNLALYGDLTGVNQMWKVWGTRPPLTLAQYKIEAWNFQTTYWANFGYGNIPAPNSVYRILEGLTALGAIGLLWRLLDRLRHTAVLPRLQNEKRLMVALWVVITAAALLWYLQRTIQVTGRQIYAIIPALSFCLVWGWARLVPRRWHVHLALVTSGLTFTFALATLLSILIPAYRPAPRLPADQVGQTILHRLDWQLGDVTTLLGYSLSPEAVAPGKEVTITLYWRPLRTPPLNYTVFV